MKNHLILCVIISLCSVMHASIPYLSTSDHLAYFSFPLNGESEWLNGESEGLNGEPKRLFINYDDYPHGEETKSWREIFKNEEVGTNFFIHLINHEDGIKIRLGRVPENLKNNKNVNGYEMLNPLLAPVDQYEMVETKEHFTDTPNTAHPHQIVPTPVRSRHNARRPVAIPHSYNNPNHSTFHNRQFYRMPPPPQTIYPSMYPASPFQQSNYLTPAPRVFNSSHSYYGAVNPVLQRDQTPTLFHPQTSSYHPTNTVPHHHEQFPTSVPTQSYSYQKSYLVDIHQQHPTQNTHFNCPIQPEQHFNTQKEATQPSDIKTEITNLTERLEVLFKELHEARSGEQSYSKNEYFGKLSEEIHRISGRIAQLKQLFLRQQTESNSTLSLTLSTQSNPLAEGVGIHKTSVSQQSLSSPIRPQHSERMPKTEQPTVPVKSNPKTQETQNKSTLLKKEKGAEEYLANLNLQLEERRKKKAEERRAEECKIKFQKDQERKANIDAHQRRVQEDYARKAQERKNKADAHQRTLQEEQEHKAQKEKKRREVLLTLYDNNAKKGFFRSLYETSLLSPEELDQYRREAAFNALSSRPCKSIDKKIARHSRKENMELSIEYLKKIAIDPQEKINSRVDAYKTLVRFKQNNQLMEFCESLRKEFEEAGHITAIQVPTINNLGVVKRHKTNGEKQYLKILISDKNTPEADLIEACNALMNTNNQNLIEFVRKNVPIFHITEKLDHQQTTSSDSTTTIQAGSTRSSRITEDIITQRPVQSSSDVYSNPQFYTTSSWLKAYAGLMRAMSTEDLGVGAPSPEKVLKTDSNMSNISNGIEILLKYIVDHYLQVTWKKTADEESDDFFHILENFRLEKFTHIKSKRLSDEEVEVLKKDNNALSEEKRVGYLKFLRLQQESLLRDNNFEHTPEREACICDALKCFPEDPVLIVSLLFYRPTTCDHSAHNFYEEYAKGQKQNPDLLLKAREELKQGNNLSLLHNELQELLSKEASSSSIT